MSELLAGERLEQESYQEKTDEMMMNFVVGGKKIWLMQLMMRAILFSGLLLWIIPTWKRDRIFTDVASTILYFGVICLPIMDQLLKYPEGRPVIVGIYAMLLVACIVAAIFKSVRSRKS